MGLRFRRSIKLAPGIRMNFSGSGMSWTLGSRGASISIGKRGTYLNAGIPGTGLYARERIGASQPSSSRSSSGSSNIRITVAIDDDGVISFRDADGNPLSEGLISAAKKQQSAAIRGLIEGKCKEINEQVQALGYIHCGTPKPDAKPAYKEQVYEEAQPSPPVPREMGIWDKLFKSRRERIDKENENREAQYRKDLKVWENEKGIFEEEERKKKHKIEVGIYSEVSVMEDFLEENLHEIAWPRETLVSAEVLEGGKRVFVDVDLPEIDEIPNKTASVPQRGYKLSVKEMSPTQVQKLYMRHVHGIGFRIIGEALAVLPNASEVVLSAFSQRPDPATGNENSEYLYSVRVHRDKWSDIDFDNLANIDVVEALSRFEFRRTMSKTGSFKAIDPFLIDE